MDSFAAKRLNFNVIGTKMVKQRAYEALASLSVNLIPGVLHSLLRFSIRSRDMIKLCRSEVVQGRIAS